MRLPSKLTAALAAGAFALVGLPAAAQACYTTRRTTASPSALGLSCRTASELQTYAGAGCPAGVHADVLCGFAPLRGNRWLVRRRSPSASIRVQMLFVGGVADLRSAVLCVSA